MVPVDSFSPSNLLSIAREDSPEWLYKKLDSYWSRWLTKDSVATITKDGFYSMNVRPGLKIVSLNTNFCHDKNFWLYINSTDPGNQLEWLVHELIMSELEHEQVHIIGHIPPGVKDCMKVWSKNFNRIVRRFSKTITGQFYGHTHNNEFELFYDEGENLGSTNSTGSASWTSIASALIGPSITTFIDLNPGFRVYNIDPNQNFKPIDFESYYMNLTAANGIPPDLDPDWISSGFFSKIFGIKDINPTELHNLIIELANGLKERESANTIQDPEQANWVRSENYELQTGYDHDLQLFKLYRLFNSHSDVYNKAQFDKMTSAEKKTFLCGFLTGQSYDDRVCNMFIRVDNSEMSVPPS